MERKKYFNFKKSWQIINKNNLLFFIISLIVISLGSLLLLLVQILNDNIDLKLTKNFLLISFSVICWFLLMFNVFLLTPLFIKIRNENNVEIKKDDCNLVLNLKIIILLLLTIVIVLYFLFFGFIPNSEYKDFLINKAGPWTLMLIVADFVITLIIYLFSFSKKEKLTRILSTIIGLLLIAIPFILALV